MSDVALLVVDECHHTVGNHSYARIMEQHYHRVAKSKSQLATDHNPGQEEWTSSSKGSWLVSKFGDQGSEGGTSFLRPTQLLAIIL